jgi:hypothetical protein
MLYIFFINLIKFTVKNKKQQLIWDEGIYK